MIQGQPSKYLGGECTEPSHLHVRRRLVWRLDSYAKGEVSSMSTDRGVAIVGDYGPQYGDREFGVRPVHTRQVARSIAGTSLNQFNHLFRDSDACLQHVFDVKFGQGFPCPACTLAASWKRRKTRSALTASCCRTAQIFPLSGTVFHRTKIPLRNWFFLMLNFTNSKMSFSSTHARHLLGTSQEVAFHMCDRIRTHLALLKCKSPSGGPDNTSTSTKRTCAALSRMERPPTRSSSWVAVRSWNSSP